MLISLRTTFESSSCQNPPPGGGDGTTSLNMGKVSRALVLCFSLLMLVSLLPHPALADPTTVIMSNTSLTADVTGSIVVGANGITLDCAGHHVSQVSSLIYNGLGIFLDHRSGVTVENCNVTGFNEGIRLLSSSGNSLNGNTASNNGFNGIFLLSSKGNALTGNTASNNFNDGILLDFSSSNILNDNMANDNPQYGFAILSSSNNSLLRNMACHNGLFDAFQDSSTGNLFSDNSFCTTNGI